MMRTIEYPSAPWILKGSAIGRVWLRDSAELASRLPDGFRVVSCWPGRTVGGVAVARYGEGSTLQYSELIFFGGIVRYEREIGLWVSRILVDSVESAAGGRAIWGLPKELAEFEWSETGCIVRQGDSIVYEFASVNPNVDIPVAVSFPTLTIVEGMPAVFRSRIAGCFGLASQVQIGDLSLKVDGPIAQCPRQ